jgi:hypothetical protein
VTNLEELVDALASLKCTRVPRRRRVLAGQLLAAGVTPADIEVLGDHCLRTVVDKEQQQRPAHGRRPAIADRGCAHACW